MAGDSPTSLGSLRNGKHLLLDPGVKLGKVRMVLWREKKTRKNKVQDVLQCAALNEKSC